MKYTFLRSLDSNSKHLISLHKFFHNRRYRRLNLPLSVVLELPLPMEPNGQEASNPAARLASLLSKREKLQDELRNIEKQVYELETTYLQDSNQFGHVSKGFEGFLSSSKSTSNLKRPRKFQPEDRIFSLSSVTSPAVDEHTGGRDDLGPGRSKGGGVPASGQGKPKKGRLAP